MQKLIEIPFFCYPKKQNLYLFYKDKKVLNNRLFKSLSLQISPKNGFLLRLRKTIVGHYFSFFTHYKKEKNFVLENQNIKIGYKNNGKLLLFSFDKKNNPKEVYKKNQQNLWNNFPFLGYSIIEKYTKEEYYYKRKFIKKALEKRWKEINNNKGLHGDFTHFNILLSSKKKIFFIDEKKTVNSKLFDHFYFYSYFMQCLSRCKTISPKDILEIKKDLQIIIKNICKVNDKKVLLINLNIEDAIGLSVLEKDKRLIEFSNFLK